MGDQNKKPGWIWRSKPLSDNATDLSELRECNEELREALTRTEAHLDRLQSQHRAHAQAHADREALKPGWVWRSKPLSDNTQAALEGVGLGVLISVVAVGIMVLMNLVAGALVCR